MSAVFYFRCAVSVGKWLSLVEHSVRDAGVGGSNPLFPTIDLKRNFILSGWNSFFLF